jgi:hypothetical protein
MSSLSTEDLTFTILFLIVAPSVTVSYFVLIFPLGRRVKQRYEENRVLEMRFFQHASFLMHSRSFSRMVSSGHLFLLTILPPSWIRRLPGFVDLDDKQRVLRLFSSRERRINLATWSAAFGGIALCFVALGLKWYWQLTG